MENLQKSVSLVTLRTLPRLAFKTSKNLHLLVEFEEYAMSEERKIII